MLAQLSFQIIVITAQLCNILCKTSVLLALTMRGGAREGGPITITEIQRNLCNQ